MIFRFFLKDVLEFEGDIAVTIPVTWQGHRLLFAVGDTHVSATLETTTHVTN
jgi:hypothetical protein